MMKHSHQMIRLLSISSFGNGIHRTNIILPYQNTYNNIITIQRRLSRTLPSESAYSRLRREKSKKLPVATPESPQQSQKDKLLKAAEQIAEKRTVASLESPIFNALLNEFQEARGDISIDQDVVDLMEEVTNRYNIREKLRKTKVELRSKRGKFPDYTISAEFNILDKRLDYLPKVNKKIWSLHQVTAMEDEFPSRPEYVKPLNKVEYGVPCRIVIANEVRRESLILSCLGGNFGIVIDSIKLISDLKNYEDDTYSKIYSPKFQNVNGEVQKEMYEFLEGFHIDTNFALFILAHSIEKEKKEYLRWLEDMIDDIV